MARQRGLISASQAASLLADDEIRALLGSGTWCRVRRGVYAEGGALPTDRFGRQLRHDDAFLVSSGTTHPRSHISAAVALGLEVLLPAEPVAHLTADRPTRWRSQHGVVLHVARYQPTELAQGAGVACLGAGRTALDLARSCPVREGVVACDSALRHGTSPAELAAALERMAGWPGVRRARRALDLADAGSESVGESLARLLVLELGVGKPETQFGLCDGHRRAYADLRVGRHLIEFDGKVKYTGAYGDGVDVLWEEKQRQDFLLGCGLGMSRLVWSDLFSGRGQALARLEREYRATCQRFGTSIADLEAFRAPPRFASGTAA